MALNKTQIFDAVDVETVAVDVPEWGGEIMLQPMTGKQRNDYEFWAHSQTQSNDFRGIRERLIIACAVGDDGKPLFDFDDMEKLSEKNADVIERLHKCAQQICGMDADAVDDAAGN